MEKEKGILDKYGMIDQCVDQLINIRVAVKDLASIGIPIVDTANRLTALKEGMQKEEADREEEVEDGQDHTAERENV